ncbi:hypothetical protein NDU88_002486 [Pleurodeles waltl]|uniref:Uncharacterized protein n=1 Tax=Pleurodeles waltl TaxID=8319 RepID=A0AAV7L1D9_PLEWA|nr:hypothetical protein NDU88_002486 [Pleurodeles waltl]
MERVARNAASVPAMFTNPMIFKQTPPQKEALDAQSCAMGADGEQASAVSSRQWFYGAEEWFPVGELTPDFRADLLPDFRSDPSPPPPGKPDPRAPSGDTCGGIPVSLGHRGLPDSLPERRRERRGAVSRPQEELPPVQALLRSPQPPFSCQGPTQPVPRRPWGCN